MNAAMVVLYEPNDKDIENIGQYCERVDLMIVLDNSSEDNYYKVNKVISIDNNRTIYKHFKKNVGLCAALNIGMNIASEKGCEWALIMDDDSSFLTDIIQVYSSYIENNDTENVVVLSPVHIYDRSRAKGYPGIKKIKWAMTSGCYYNIKHFHELGGFFEDLFVECLDLDYCYKALEKGYATIECGEALLKHHPAETKILKILGIEIMKYGYASPWRYYMQARSLTWLIFRYRHIGDLIRLIWKIAKVILFFENKNEYLKQIRKGQKDGWRIYYNNR